jgi:DNA-binding NarL/FixJ family response regulator
MQTSENEKHGILLVDDHPVVRDGIRRLVESNQEFIVCGETGNGDEVMGLVGRLRPAAIILDLSLEGADGLALLGNLHARYPAIPILVVSMYSEDTHAHRCLEAGARGYVMKKSAPADIIQALRTIREGDIYVSESARNMLLNKLVDHKRQSSLTIDKLSPREFQVFCLYGEGMQTAHIADKLHCSPKTIETHSLRIRNKLGLACLAELIARAGAHAGRA